MTNVLSGGGQALRPLAPIHKSFTSSNGSRSVQYLLLSPHSSTMSSDDSALALSTAECDAMICFLEKRDLKGHPLVQDFLEKLKTVAVAVSGTGWHQAAPESIGTVYHADEPAHVDSSEPSDLGIQKVEVSLPWHHCYRQTSTLF